jgi:hypothetical protein
VSRFEEVRPDIFVLRNLALESMSAMALSFPEMCRISGFRDLMYAIHRSIAKSGVAHPETMPRIGRQSVSITTSVPTRWSLSAFTAETIPQSSRIPVVAQ